MTLLTRLEKQVKSRSKDRPKSLLLLIPAMVRDLMDLKVNDTLILDIVEENNKRYMKIYKKQD